jgi:N-acetylglucosamine-6-phosphate deacetylase
MLLPRHDNIIQRVLACSDRLWIGLIGDGVHVPYFVLRNWLRGIGTERAFIVTDAISAAGLGPGEFRLADRSYVVDNDLATWAADRSHLVGSASTMSIMAEKLRTKAGLTDEIIRQLTSVNPRRVIGISA